MISGQLILRTKVLPSNFNLIVDSKSYRKMELWESEKKEMLSLDSTKKREFHKYKNIQTVHSIPTWKEYASVTNLLPKIEALPGNEIDTSKNSILANKISYYYGDITALEIDAIVNSANNKLLGGGGADGAIHAAAGTSLREECRTLHGCETGEAKITGGYKLPAKYVIHTVGPIEQKPDLLRNCYANSLKILLENNLRTVAFPCISTGLHGYPKLDAAHIAAHTVRKHLEANTDKIDRVIFCVFLPENEKIYKQLLQSYFPLE